MATEVGAPIGYRQGPGLARRLHSAIDQIDALASRGDHHDVIELTEHAIRRIDSRGEMLADVAAYTRAALRRLEELHASACAGGGVGPRDLAERLIDAAATGCYPPFAEAYGTHADALGVEGRAHYRLLALEAWRDCAAVSGAMADPTSIRLGAILGVIGAIEGDADLMIAPLLARPLDNLALERAAELLPLGGRSPNALLLARRVADVAKRGAGDAMLEMLIDYYAGIDRPSDAAQFALQAFSDRPGPVRWITLKRHALAAGEWSSMRTAAIELLQRAPVASVDDDASAVVACLLADGDVDGAWSAALDGGCAIEGWLALADARSAGNPDDALAIYMEVAVDLAESGTLVAYRRVVELLMRMSQCVGSDDRRFAGYLAAIRGEFSRKRNLMMLIDEAFGPNEQTGAAYDADDQGV